MTTLPEPAPYFPSAGKFRKKPVVIEAWRWDGKDITVLSLHKESNSMIHRWPDSRDSLRVFTLEGAMRAEIGDWIIKGVKGEFYPCKDDIFTATYEPVPE
jgi:hypothetical protein